MQLTQMLTALVAISATASAVALDYGQGKGEGGGDGGSVTCSNVSACKQGGLFSFLSPNTCQNSGGQAYCCTATGLINIFSCDNLVNGNIDILDLFDIIGQK